jgi:CdiI immunity protein
MGEPPNYPRLRRMFGAFFHQNWDAEGDDWPDLVRNYVRGKPAAELLATAAEADALAAEGDSDEELERRLEQEFGCCYDAHPDGGAAPRIGKAGRTRRCTGPRRQ